MNVAKLHPLQSLSPVRKQKNESQPNAGYKIIHLWGPKEQTLILLHLPYRGFMVLKYVCPWFPV
jgi:hypothetical protein